MLYDVLAQHYDQVFPFDPARVEFIASRLSRPGAAILDVGCATGSLALALADRGYAVSGIDLNPAMMTIAQTRGHGRAAFEVRNMLDLATGPRYDAVLCLGNTLPHLLSAHDVRTFVNAAAASLKTGGVLMVQTLNFDRVLREGRIAFDPIETESLILTRNYTSIGRDRLTFQTELLDKTTGTRWNDDTPLRPLLKPEWSGFLSAWFSPVEWFSDFQGTPSTGDEFATLSVATLRG